MSERAPGRAAALVPMALIVSLFFLWGVANNLNDVLVAQFRKAFALNDLQSGLVQSAFYLGYFVFAMPAALWMRRFGYKAAVVLGLCLFGAGALLFWPAAQVRVYGAFLGALFVIASGLAFLETSANPLMTVLGPPEGGARRLNFAQAFNPLGSITGVLIGRQFIFTGADAKAGPGDAFRAAAAHAVQGPYLAIGLFVLVWAGLILAVRFPEAASAPSPEERVGGGPAEIGRLFARPRFVFGVIAQFFYVGAQVGVWSYLIRYAQREAGADERTAASYLTAALVLFMAGRFGGTALMGKVRPDRLMAAFAAAAATLCLVGVFAGGQAGLLALVGASFFMSIMFPTIFALAIADLGPLTKFGSSFVVMAIIGGAAVTALMGWVSDSSSIAIAMLVPAGCFACVLAFALAGRAQARLAPQEATP
jgi:FHS family L-fucose permease-like MFS transporter